MSVLYRARPSRTREEALCERRATPPRRRPCCRSLRRRLGRPATPELPRRCPPTARRPSGRRVVRDEPRAARAVVANLRDGAGGVVAPRRERRSAFHRIRVMAPYVFDTVVNVDTGRRIEQNGATAVVAIVARGHLFATIRHGRRPGARRGAHMKAAMSANPSWSLQVVGGGWLRDETRACLDGSRFASATSARRSRSCSSYLESLTLVWPRSAGSASCEAVRAGSPSCSAPRAGAAADVARRGCGTPCGVEDQVARTLPKYRSSI